MKVLRAVWKVVWRAANAFIEDEALTHGAAIAFFSGLSLGPILIVLLWLSSLLGPGMQERLVEQVAGLVGGEGAEVVRIVFENADQVETGSFAGWISLGALLVSSTAVFAQLQVALNAVWGVEATPSGLGIWYWLRKRLISLGLIVSFGFLLLVSLAVSSALAAVTQSMRDLLPASTVTHILLDLAIPFAIYLAMFMAVFRYLPDAAVEWRHVWFGALVTTSLFVLGKWLIGVYLGTSALGSAYGAAGSLILTLLWTYYSAAIVLFGAEITQAYVRQRGEHIEIEPHAEPTEPERKVRATTQD